MKKNYALLFLLFIFSLSSYPQGWEKVYENMYFYDNYTWQISAQQMKPTSDGGFIFTGYRNSGTVTIGCIIKTDVAGNVQWAKTIGDSGFYILPVCVSEIGNHYYVGGQEYNPQKGFICQFDLAGNLNWTKSFSQFVSIERIEPGANGLMLSGSPYSNGMMLAYITYSGVLQWARSYDVPYLTPSAALPLPDHGFLMVGKKTSYTYGLHAVCYAVKVDSAGNTVWSRSFGYSSEYDFRSIIRLPNGHFLLLGTDIMEIDANGQLVWVKLWYGQGVIRDAKLMNGHIYTVSGDYINDTRIMIHCLALDGTPLWETKLGTKKDQPCCLQTLSDGSLMIYGWHNDVITHSQGVYLIKADSLGQSGCNTEMPELYPSHIITVGCADTDCNIVNPVTPSITPNPMTAASFTVSVKDPCCSAHPQITFGSDAQCRGNVFTYSVNGGPHVHWYTGDTTQSITTSDTVVTVAIINSCGTFSDTLRIHPVAPPVITYTIDKTSVCAGDSISLSVSANAASYGCYGAGVKTLANHQYSIKPPTSGNYTLYATNAVYGPGCSSQQTFTIQVTPNKPWVAVHHDTLISSSPIDNQWYIDGNPLPGETLPTLIAQTAGTYAVRVSSGSCANMSADVIYAPDTIHYTRNAWQKTFVSSQGYTYGSRIAETADSGYVIGGLLTERVGNNWDYVLAKTDKDGNMLWAKKIASAGGQTFWDMAKNSSGVVLAGTIANAGAGNADGFLYASDLNGNTLWSKTYGTWNAEEFIAITPCASGGYLVTGSITNPLSYTVTHDGWFVAAKDILVVRLDDNGNQLWAKSFDFALEDRAVFCAETSSGQLVVVSTTQDQLQNRYETAIMLMNSSGDPVWQRSLSSNGSPAGLTITADNSIAVVLQGYPGTDLVKLDLAGNILFFEKLDIGYGTNIRSLQDSSVVFVSGSFAEQHYMTKVNAQGIVVWSSTFDHADYLSGLVQTRSGSFVAVGGDDTSTYDINDHLHIIKSDAQGLLNCNGRFTPAVTNGTYTATSLSVAATQANITEGNPSLTISSIAYSPLTYCHGASQNPTTGIHNTAQSLTFEISPNPADDKVKVISHSETESQVRILDITGRVLLKKNFYMQETLDVSTIEPGVYVIEVSSGGKRNARTLIVQ